MIISWSFYEILVGCGVYCDYQIISSIVKGYCFDTRRISEGGSDCDHEIILMGHLDHCGYIFHCDTNHFWCRMESSGFLQNVIFFFGYRVDDIL